MKKVWYDLDEKTKDIITTALDVWCVPHHEVKHETELNWFNTVVTYDVVTNLSIEKKNGKSPYDFVIDEVNRALRMETDYKGRPFTKPHTKEEKALAEKLDESETKRELQHRNVMAQKRKDEQLLKALEHTDKICERSQNKVKSISEFVQENKKPSFWGNLLNKLFPKKEVQDKQEESLEQQRDLTTWEDLPAMDEMNILNGLIGTLLPAMTGIGMGKRVAFEELPYQIQSDLSAKYPIEMLKSDDCHIFQCGEGRFQVVLMKKGE